MEEEVFVRQTDGRLVAGPSLSSSSEDAPRSRGFLRFVVVLLWAASLMLSFAGGIDFGSRPELDLHEQVVARLQEGCVFQFKGISTTAEGQADLEQKAEDAQRILEGQGNAKNIRWTSVEAQDGVRRMDPTATRLVVVSWEVCRQMELGDVWNIKFGALWEPNKVEQVDTVEPLESVDCSMCNKGLVDCEATYSWNHDHNEYCRESAMDTDVVLQTCESCNGAATQECPWCIARMLDPEDCEECGATGLQDCDNCGAYSELAPRGQVVKHKCVMCDGTGEMSRPKTAALWNPAEVESMESWKPTSKDFIAIVMHSDGTLAMLNGAGGHKDFCAKGTCKRCDHARAYNAEECECHFGKTAALWNPSDVEPMPLKRDLDYVRYDWRDDATSGLMVPASHLDSLLEHKPDVTSNIDAIFGYGKKSEREPVQDWMKENYIPWIGYVGTRAHWILQSEPTPLSKNDFKDMLVSLKRENQYEPYEIVLSNLREDNTLRSFTFSNPPNHQHDIHEHPEGWNPWSGCNDCVDEAYNKYTDLFLDYKTAALWDPSKVDLMPESKGKPDTIPLHWDYRDTPNFVCEDSSHHHWTVTDPHEDCDDKQHIDDTGNRYKSNSIVVTSPSEGYPNGYNEEFKNAAYIVPNGHKEGFKQLMDNIQQDYNGVFNHEENRSKEKVYDWMDDNNVPWVSLLTTNNNRNLYAYLLQQVPAQKFSQEEFKDFMQVAPSRQTIVVVSGDSRLQPRTSHNPNEHGDEICDTCFDEIYEAYSNLKDDLHGTE